ncbi:tyrosine-type recombinase/integrase [Kiritimatiellaeota bacterium B1221]|nr:tyrosine-type recombinase/integrase [Kiritimatiellaeota bacterium B1221]
MPTEYIANAHKRHNGGIIRKTTAGRWVAEINRDNKRRRASFDKISKAKSWIDKETSRRGDQGKDAFTLNRPQLMDAADAIHKLRTGGRKESLCNAVDFFLKHHPATDDRLTVEECLTRYETEMKTPSDGGTPARPESIRNKRKRLTAFLTLHGERDVREITQADIDTWAKSFAHLAPRTQVNRKAELQSVLNFAEGILPEFKNTVCTIKQKKKKGGSPAEILTPEIVEIMLRKLEEKYPPRYAVTFALMNFAGIRPAELTRPDNPLTWESIRLDKGKIYVHAHTAKTGDWRDVPIFENLAAWLKRYPGKGRISPSDSRFREARSVALKAAGLDHWPHDGARHSFGTYAGELHGLHKAAGWMGHTGGLSVFQAHYKGRATPEQAKAFFNIKPTPAKSGTVIQMEVGA